MHIGKREQIVISVIVTLVVIGLMHFLIFSPAQSHFKTAKGNYEQQSSQIQTLKTIKDRNELTSFTRQTENYISELTSGTRFLHLESAEAFQPYDWTKVKVDVPAGMSADDAFKLKLAANTPYLIAQVNEQTTMVLQQIALLQAHIADKSPVMSFLGPRGWNLPTALPPSMQGGALFDLLKAIDDTRGTLKALSSSTQVYQTLLTRYTSLQSQLGMNTTMADQLNQYGEFVPLYYRLAFAELIREQMIKTGHNTIGDKELTLTLLLELLGVSNSQSSSVAQDIKMPFDPLPGMTDPQLYFAYEELRQLNQVLDMANEFQLVEINNVTLYPFGYLRQQDSLLMANNAIAPEPDKLISDETWVGATAVDAMVTATPTPDASQDTSGSGDDQNGGGPSAAASTDSATPTPTAEQDKAKPDEIGIALPIKITFRADNLKSWNFMYEVLRRQPLVELNRLDLTSLSVQDPNNQNIEASVTYLFVPKLFETIDAVNQVLKEIKATESGPKGPGGTAAAPTPSQ